MDQTNKTYPFHSFLWKVASRCNINCTYCYGYNLGDDTWKALPHFLSPRTARRAAERMREHLEAHGKKDAAIIFHGGEPMMLGTKRLAALVSEVRDVFAGTDLQIKIGMQSNLMLFNETMGELMSSEGISVGVSLDGPQHVNDVYRLDHKGRGTSKRIEAKLKLLLSPRFHHLFSGLLCVVNPETDPEEVLDHFLSFEPHSIDFLLPLNNHDSPPKGHEGGSQDTLYGDWMIRCFNHWIASGTRTRVRYFESIIRMLCGNSTSVESIGLLPVDIIVVETNGAIEAVDSLKSAFSGAAQLGFSVHSHSFDEVAAHYAVRIRQLGADGLCETCQRCKVVDVCGGGYYPHRYSKANGFSNPSVYCADLMKLIGHINRVVADEIRDRKPPTKRIAAGAELVSQ
jgi:uncharacterized protein